MSGIALNNNLTIKTNLRWIPDCGIDDQCRWVTVPEAEAQTGIDRTTILRYRSKRGYAFQKINYRWYLRLRALTKIVEGYRYGVLGKQTGNWWSKEELQLLFNKDLTHTDAMRKINRSYRSICTLRFKLGVTSTDRNTPIGNMFFVSPHALRRYRERIIDLTAKQVIWNILDGLRKPIEISEFSNQQGMIVVCRGRHKLLDFRAVIATGSYRKWPQVVTITEGIKR